MRSRAILVLIGLWLAGCASPNPPGPDSDPAPAVGEYARALTFTQLGAIGRGWTVLTGEPSLAVAPDGALFARHLGCDDSVAYLADLGGHELAGASGRTTCIHGRTLRSQDEGKTWSLLNDPVTGRLSDEAPAGDGDPDIAIDAAGSIYTVDMGCEQTTLSDPQENCRFVHLIAHRSDDRGDSWAYLGEILPTGEQNDRPWITAADAGHIIVTWWDPESSPDHPAPLDVRTSFDGGRTFSEAKRIREGIGWLGKPQFARDSLHVYIPFTVPDPPDPSSTQRVYALHVGRSVDGGRTWEDIDTGVKVSARRDSHRSGLAVAPNLAVTRAGHVAWLYTDRVPATGGATESRVVVKATWSFDAGSTWSPPVEISRTPSAIMPWGAALPDGHLVVTYYANKLEGDPNYVGLWDVEVAVVDLESGAIAHGVVAPDVHRGGLCSSTLACDFSPREFFQNAVLPDGRIAVVYSTDPVEGGKFVEIHAAIQGT